MPLIQLNANLRWFHGDRTFERGVPQEVSEDLFHELSRTGSFGGAGQFLETVYLKNLPQMNVRGESLTIIRDMGLGDVLMLWPTVRAFKLKFPNIKLTYAVGSAYVDLFRGWAEDYVEAIVPLTTMQGHIKAIDLRGYSERADDRRTEHRVDVFANYMQVQPLADRSVRVRLQPPEVDEAAALLRTHGWDGVTPLAMVAWRGSSGHRSIPQHIVLATLRALLADGFLPVVVDQESPNVQVDGVLNLGGATNVRQLAAVLSHATIVISPDTGVYHLAQAVGRPTVVVFSTVDPDKRVRYYPNCETIWHNEVPCAPCWDTGCEPIPCLMRVTATEIMAAVRKLVPQVEAVTVAVGTGSGA